MDHLTTDENQVGHRHHQPARHTHGIPTRVPCGMFTKILGLVAILWLFLRSGSKPTRLSYPCQQSALGLAMSAYAAPLAVVGLGKRATRRGFAGICVLMLIAAGMGTLGVFRPWNADSVAVMVPPPQDYHPQLFVVNDARSVEGDRFGGIDDLVTLMGGSEQPLYRSSFSTDRAGPSGVVAADSVVLIKVNAQWSERGGTNTDVLSGLIRVIVEHPDGFTGEVVVADNGQGSGSLTRPFNNSVNHSQSVRTVIDHFAGQGWRVSLFLWDNLRLISVGEYADGDARSGYVVASSFDPQTNIRVSYPKFMTPSGTLISYKHGVWSPSEASYDAERLVVINLPVLKTHQIYGVTAAVKNHMGVVTQSQGTDSHLGVGRGGLGSLLSQVRRPDLSILDCIWVLAIPGAGPSASYSQSTACDKLVAGTDPVALDAWAAKFILIPKIEANGYTPAAYAAQSPDNAEGAFRRYLDRTMNQLLAADIPTTNDYAAVRLRSWSNDDDLDGDLDLIDFGPFLSCLNGPGQEVPAECGGADFTLDGKADLRDVARLIETFTGPAQ